MRLLILAGVLFAQGAWSDEALGQTDPFGVRRATCPVCEQEFEYGGGRHCHFTWGRDSDLRWRSTGDGHELILSCYRCGYVRSTRSFASAPSPEVCAKIRAEIEPTLQKRRIAAEKLGFRLSRSGSWEMIRERYQHAQQILEWEEAPAWEMANHFRRAGWAMRAESGQLIGGLRFFSETRDDYEQSKQHPEKDSPDIDPSLLWAESLLGQLRQKETEIEPGKLVVAAAIFAAVGETGHAQRLFEAMARPALAKSTVLSSPMIQGFLGDLRELVEEEVRFLNRHLDFAEQCLTGERDPQFHDAKRAVVAGETSRKRGEADQALRWYSIAISNAENPPWFVEHVAELYQRVAGEAYPESDRLALLRASQERALIALENPEKTDEGLENLRDQGGALVVEGLTRALDSRYGEVRSNAALLLRSHHDCSDVVVAKLGSLLVDDPEVAWQAALGIAEFGRPASLPAVVEVITRPGGGVAEGYAARRILQAMVMYLGFLGDESHVELIWRLRQQTRDEAQTALERLANRELPQFQTIEELRKWFAEHRPGTQEQWAVAGLKEVGIELPALGDPARVAGLVDLLEHEEARIRCHAVRLLRIETGQSFPWQSIASDSDGYVIERQRREAVELWSGWAAEKRAAEKGTDESTGQPPKTQPQSEREGVGMSHFADEWVSLEEQLETLAALGLKLNAGVGLEELTMFEEREELEDQPYQGLIEAMGRETETEPEVPICASLWLCDYERVYDDGDYSAILERLEQMTGGALGLASIRDHVDLEEEVAWVEFELKGDRVRWDFEVDDDWLDPMILVKYDDLLKNVRSEVRLYSNHTDYGQEAFIGAFTAEHKREFDKLSRVKFAPVPRG